MLRVIVLNDVILSVIVITLMWRYDTESNNTQDNAILDNDTQYDGTHCNNIQHYSIQYIKNSG